MRLNLNFIQLFSKSQNFVFKNFFVLFQGFLFRIQILNGFIFVSILSWQIIYFLPLVLLFVQILSSELIEFFLFLT